MSGRYTNIHSCTWTDETFMRLDADAKMLFLYILTSPHSNMIGYYRLPILYIAADLQWQTERTEETMGKLVTHNMLHYDKDSSVVLIPNFLKYNRIQNANQAKGAVNTALRVPANSLLDTFLRCIDMHVGEYVGHFEILRKTVGTPLSNPLGNPSETVTQTVTEPLPKRLPNTVNSKQRTVNSKHILAQAQESTPTDDQTKPTQKEMLAERFERFWTAYPKKRSKGAAEKAWRQIKPSEQLLEQMLSTLERAKTSKSWLEKGGEYIPYPATWLNAKGWEDEYEQPSNHSAAREVEEDAFGEQLARTQPPVTDEEARAIKARIRQTGSPQVGDIDRLRLYEYQLRQAQQVRSRDSAD